MLFLKRPAIYIFIFLSVKAFAGDTIPVTTPIQLLSKLVQFRSISGNERSVGLFLLNKSEEFGFATHVFSEKDSAFNFSASLYPLELQKPNIVFLSHLDIVPALDSESWKVAPFSGSIVNDTVWGRGCLDMKGIGLMQLLAAKDFLKESKEKDLPYNVTVLFVSGEESGGQNGSKIITENYLNILHPTLVIGEGGGGVKGVLPSKPEKTVFFISVVEKKSLWLKLTVQEHANGHSSMPWKKTANSILMKTVDELEDKEPIIIFDKTSRRMFHDLGEMNGGFKGFILKNTNKWIIRPFRRRILESNPALLNEVVNTVTLTNFSNPQGPPNVISGKATAYIDCRLLPGITSQKFIRKLKMRIHNPKVDITIVDQSPDENASEIDNKYEAISNAIKIIYPGSEVLPFIFPATTDNSYFRSKEVQSFGLLPMEFSEELIESVHGINECISVNSFNKGMEVYKQIIEELMKAKNG